MKVVSTTEKKLFRKYYEGQGWHLIRGSNRDIKITEVVTVSTPRGSEAHLCSKSGFVARPPLSYCARVLALPPVG